jgi:hypothetical protein
MPDFVDKLSQRIEEKAHRLKATLSRQAEPGEQDLMRLVRDNWNPLPDGILDASPQVPAFAVDGSIRQLDLANGAYLFVAQALCLGQNGFQRSDVDIEILRGTIFRGTVERFADLMQRRLEVTLALECAGRIEPGSVLYLDGALYGQLPQLYPLDIKDLHEYDDLPAQILAAYVNLFALCRERDIRLISIAKTSREATHCKLWRDELELDMPVDLPDSEMIHRWTENRAGFSTPVILGEWGFTGGSRELLQRPEVKGAPAIISFFVRLVDYDDAFRVDLPAYCLGDERRLGDLDADVLDPDEYNLTPILQLLAADYGGPEVYNAPLYSVDREVRLGRSMMNEVYLRLVEGMLGCPVPLDRSERRF